MVEGPACERRLMSTYPRLQDTVLDCTDVRALAEFWRQYLGLRYRDGDEPAEHPFCVFVG